MFYLVSQVWIFILIALVLGFVAGWLFWARPIQKAVAELEKH